MPIEKKPIKAESIKVFSLAAHCPGSDAMLSTLTPTGLTASLCRVMPFTMPGNMTINKIVMRFANSLADAAQLGIFDSQGVRVWNSGALSITTNWNEITVNLPVSLTNQTYYWRLTNNNLVSGTAAYNTSTGVGSGVMPGFGTVAATNGVMPTSITPASINMTAGGWPCYVMFFT